MLMEGSNSPLRRWGLGLLICTVVALFFVAQAHIYYAFESKNQALVKVGEKDWGQTLLWEFSGWYLWGLFSVPIYKLAKRFPLDKNSWWRHLPVHLVAGVLFSIAHLVIHVGFLTLVDRGLQTSYELSTTFVTALLNRFTWRVHVYFFVLTACHVILIQQKYSEQERRAARLETQLAQAQLQALKMQLQPHFLFNTLQSISELMHVDIETADEMMVRLAQFLRLALENNSQEVPLEKELEFLRCYLEIEELRFKDRLKVRIDIQPEALAARVPNLILQPIVENAIRHGIAPNEFGEIEIRAVRAGEGVLRLQISDNGAGLPENSLRQDGIGLTNTRARLEQHYGNQQRLKLEAQEQGGVLVTMELPFQVAV